ncbi:TPA: hypothetical protein ACGO0F_001327 [Streptococcus suis]
MEVSVIKFHHPYLSKEITIEIPKYCPNCGIGNNPTTHYLEKLDIQEGHVFGLHHRCPSCNQKHMTLQNYVNNSNEGKLEIAYPNKVIMNIDPIFIECAPRFVEFYSEAVEAERIGLTNVAGTGYRSAIECLIKDYALHFELDSKDYLANPKFSFNNAIDRYIKDDELLNGALHFIREVGNHYTHWSKETDIPLDVLKSYIEIIIQIFKSKFMLKHLPK